MMMNIYFQSKRWMVACMATLILSLSGCHSLQQSEDATIIPQPLSVEKGNGSFSFSEKTVIAVAIMNNVSLLKILLLCLLNRRDLLLWLKW